MTAGVSVRECQAPQIHPKKNRSAADDGCKED